MSFPAGKSMSCDAPIRIEIFDQTAVENFRACARTMITDSDERKRVEILLKQLDRLGSHRFVAWPGTDWRDKLDALEGRFPPFSEVIDYVRGVCAMGAMDGGRSMIFQPLALVGGAGIGKSYFSSALASIFNVPVNTIQLNTSQSNSTLSGSSSYWANAAPGKIFENLIFGNSASPVFVLEEIEKTGKNLQFDPLNSLFQLFEPQSAQRFSDMCYPWLEIDASRVIYICTANSLTEMEAPILSRIKVFNIAPASESDSAHTIKQIFSSLLIDLPECFKHMQISNSAIEAIICLPPRIVRNVLRDAIGRAAYDGKFDNLERADVQRACSKSDSRPGHIGFV